MIPVILKHFAQFSKNGTLILINIALICLENRTIGIFQSIRKYTMILNYILQKEFFIFMIFPLQKYIK